VLHKFTVYLLIYLLFNYHKITTIVHSYHFADLAAQSVGNAMSLVDIDADTFAKNKLHGSRVTELHDHLHYEVDSLIVWCHSVKMDGVVHR